MLHSLLQRTTLRKLENEINFLNNICVYNICLQREHQLVGVGLLMATGLAHESLLSVLECVKPHNGSDRAKGSQRAQSAHSVPPAPNR